MLEGIPKYMKGGSDTPAAHHLFGVTEDVTKRSQADVNLFHHFVAQLMYLSKRARPEI